MGIADQRAATNYLAVLHRQQTRDRAALDLLDPCRQHLWLDDVARQEQQIMSRQSPCQVEHGGLIRWRHQAEFDVARIGLDAARIGTCFAAHIYLSPNHESSFGHSRLRALAPATRLTWPPFSMTSSLSVEPTFWIRCLAAS